MMLRAMEVIMMLKVMEMIVVMILKVMRCSW